MLTHLKEEGNPAPSIVTRFFEKKMAFGATSEEEQVLLDVAYTTFGGMSRRNFCKNTSDMCAGASESVSICNRRHVPPLTGV